MIWPRAWATSGVGLAAGVLEGGAGPVDELAPVAEGGVDAGGAGVERFGADLLSGRRRRRARLLATRDTAIRALLVAGPDVA